HPRGAARTLPHLTGGRRAPRAPPWHRSCTAEGDRRRSRHSIRHRIQHRNLGFLAVPLLLVAGCGPGEGGDETLDAGRAEAPPMPRPTTARDCAAWAGDGDLPLVSAEFSARGEDEGPFDGWFEDDTLNVAAMQEDALSSPDVRGEGQVDQNDWEAA